MLKQVVILACICGLTVHTGLTVESDQQPPATGLTLDVKIVSRDEFLVVVRNNSAEPVVFSPWTTGLVLYHRSPSGVVTSLSYDGSDADMSPLGAFDTVNLPPKGVYQVSLDFWVNKYRDQRQFLGRSGTIYAILHPLRLGSIDSQLRSAALRAPLLKVPIRSNEVRSPVPLPPSYPGIFGGWQL